MVCSGFEPSNQEMVGTDGFSELWWDAIYLITLI